MTQQEIKSDAEAQYAVIKEAENRLKEIRDICKHPSTFRGLYSANTSGIAPAIICSDCGALIK